MAVDACDVNASRRADISGFRVTYPIERLKLPAAFDGVADHVLVRAADLGDADAVAREIYDVVPEKLKATVFWACCTEEDRLPCLCAWVGETPLGAVSLLTPPLPPSIMAEYMARYRCTEAQASAKVCSEGWSEGMDRAAEVWALVVGEKYRGVGVGGLLFDATCRAAASCGFESVYATTTTDNLPGIKLYRNAGCQPVLEQPVGGRFHFKKMLI